MNTLYSLREWIHECERFLFLAEVHYHKEDVDKDSPYCVSFDACLSPEEFCLLKSTLDDVCCENWGQMGLDKVLEAQKVLHKLGKAVDMDIMQTYESRGYPSFYKVCGVRYV